MYPDTPYSLLPPSTSAHPLHTAHTGYPLASLTSLDKYHLEHPQGHVPPQGPGKGSGLSGDPVHTYPGVSRTSSLPQLDMSVIGGNKSLFTRQEMTHSFFIAWQLFFFLLASHVYF